MDVFDVFNQLDPIQYLSKRLYFLYLVSNVATKL